jgi:hypothetical protein
MTSHQSLQILEVDKRALRLIKKGGYAPILTNQNNISKLPKSVQNSVTMRSNARMNESIKNVAMQK